MLQIVVNGLIMGLLYSLMAIGFALVYNTTKVFHIAAAGIYVFAAFMFYCFTVTFGLPVLFSALVSVVLTMGLSLLTEVAVYRPLKQRKASNNVAMIVSIGLMVVIVNLLSMFFGNEAHVIGGVLREPYAIGNIIITNTQLWQLTVSGLVIALFLLFLDRGQWGFRLRALSANSSLYESLGYNSFHTRTSVFLLSGAIIAVASCLMVYDTGLDPHIGMNVLINAIVAMIIGGVGRFGTCVLGGITLGILQALAVYVFSSNWQNAITFVLLLVLLFMRPQGIAGYKQRTV